MKLELAVRFPRACMLALCLLTLIGAQTGARAAGYPLRIEAVPDEDGVWQVIAHNRGSAPIYVQLELTNVENVRNAASSKGNGKTLEAGAREVMIDAVPIDPDADVKFGWNVKWVFGRGNGRLSHDGLYRPPFPGDLTFDTTNTAREHPARERYAIDILMPPGTPVIAARSGWVMDVSGEEGSDRVEEGLTPSYMTAVDVERMGAYVRIFHEDGTWAEYLNLEPGSIKVTPGMKVEAGTQMARSGSQMGTEPHITFVVLKSQTGFVAPESIPLKMEMAGRGVVAVVAGNAMGASLSIAPGAAITQADPLVIAQVQRGWVSELAGGLKIREQLEKDPRVAIGVLGAVALLSLSVIWLALRRIKGNRTWKEWATAPRRKRGSDAEMQKSRKISEDEMFAAARMQGTLRPEPGYLIADWESGSYSSLCLAMDPGHQVVPKLSLNRVFARPSKWLEWPSAHAQMRGEAIDFAVVRLRDSRIVAAVFVKRAQVSAEWESKAEEMRNEMLSKAGVQCIELDGGEGPEEIRKRLGSAMSQSDALAFRQAA